MKDGLDILVVNWLDRENPQAGGAETHLHEIFGRLVSRGHRVALLASGWDGCVPRVTLDGIEVHRTGHRYTFSVAAPRYFRRNLRTRAFDVVVEDLNKVPVFTPYWTNAPVVLLVHHLFGATAFREAGPLLAAGTWFLERPIPHVFKRRPTIAISKSTRDDLVARGMRAESIEVIPNGIDTDLYTPAPDGRRYERPTVLYLGRVKKYKCVDLILAAVAVLAAEGLDLRLVVGGKGDYLATLRALASRLGISDRVEFPGFVDDESKLELFRRSWVHVLASPKEGWGIANLEAAACGTPTVASDAPGLRESVVDGETGFLVPHGDVNALARRIELILRDPELRATLGRGGRRFAESYSWDASAEAMEGALRRVVASRRPG